jgi:hypothetical protein
MNTSLAMNAYQSHDLSIMMKTSSGDVINMDFSNQQSLEMQSQKDENGSQSSLSFSSMQSFQFSMHSNGIDEQDKKEIAEFMKQARPCLDKFTKELDSGDNTSPVNKIAKNIADAFSPAKISDQNTQNFAKNSIVSMFDDSLKSVPDPIKISDQMQALLEKTLKQFDKLTNELYA